MFAKYTEIILRKEELLIPPSVMSLLFPLCSSFPRLRGVGAASKEEKMSFIVLVLVCWN